MKRLIKWILRMIVILFTFHYSLLIQAENYPYRSDYLWLTVPDHADWLYKTGEKAKVEVTFCLYGIPQNVEVSYEIGPDMMPAASPVPSILPGDTTTMSVRQRRATLSGTSSQLPRSRLSHPLTNIGHQKRLIIIKCYG